MEKPFHLCSRFETHTETVKQTETMTAQLATQPKQHSDQVKAWAVSLYNGGATCYEVEKKTGIRASYIRTLAKRFSEKKEVAPAETVSPVSEMVAPETIAEKQVETAAKHSFNWYAIGFRIGCILIVVGHALLIAYDAATLWGEPGKIGGCVAFLVVTSTLVISADLSQRDVSENMVWLVFLVDAAAFFIHYRTFWYSNRVKGGMEVTEIETAFFAGFICVFSAAALYFFRQSLVKNLAK